MVSNGDDKYIGDIIGLAVLAEPGSGTVSSVRSLADVPGIVLDWLVCFTLASVRMEVMLTIERLPLRLSERIPPSVMSDFVRLASIQSRSRHKEDSEVMVLKMSQIRGGRLQVIVSAGNLEVIDVILVTICATLF